MQRKLDAVRRAVEQRNEEIKAALGAGQTPAALDIEQNIDKLVKALSFSPTQKQLLMFFACSEIGGFDKILKASYPDDIISREDYIRSLASITGMNAKVIDNELNPQNVLVRMGFLTSNADNSYAADEGLKRVLTHNYSSEEALLLNLIGPQPETDLTAKNYAYMGEDFDHMRDTLTGFIKDKDSLNKNTTIMGPPGTGKTELTGVMAKVLGVPAFLVGVAEKDPKTGQPEKEPSREERLRALIRSAYIIKKTGMQALLVMDESEDVLRDLNREGTNETGSKAHVNELLENLGVPVIFITNRADLFDPATIRRAMPCYVMNYMPLKARMEAIIEKSKQYIGVTLTPHDVKSLSLYAEQLSIAVIDRCISTSRHHIPKDAGQDVALSHIGREFYRALTAQNNGVPPPPIVEPFSADNFYPEFIAADRMGIRLHDTLQRKPEGFAGVDVIIIGEPGTGRKSLAHYIASATEMGGRVVHLSLDQAKTNPNNVHALDLERSAVDGTPIIFVGDDVLPFLMYSNGHPLLERVRNHSLATFFVSNTPPENLSQAALNQGLSHLTFIIKTNTLSSEQLLQASATMLEVDDLTPADLEPIGQQTIGAVSILKRQLTTLRLMGDKSAVLEGFANNSERIIQLAPKQQPSLNGQIDYSVAQPLNTG